MKMEILGVNWSPTWECPLHRMTHMRYERKEPWWRRRWCGSMVLPSHINRRVIAFFRFVCIRRVPRSLGGLGKSPILAIGHRVLANLECRQCHAMSGFGIIHAVITHPEFAGGDGNKFFQITPVTQHAEGATGDGPVHGGQPAAFGNGLQPTPHPLAFLLVARGGVRARLGQPGLP